jgi:hypothetical protein
MDMIWVVIILMLVAAIPDLLRKKRRYPSRGKGGPIPIPERRNKGKVHGPIVTPTRQRAQQKDVPSTKTAAPQTEKQPKPVAQPLPSIPAGQEHKAAVYSQYVMPTVAVSQPPRAAAWSGLHGDVRDIYAGLVWSELLQPPVALRQNRRR